MIISHEHRFIFFAVPKTGTQSVRASLRQHLGRGDWEQADWKVAKRLPIPEVARLVHGHIQVAQIRPLLDAGIWQQYFKFAFVRNPWDRYVSSAFFRNRKRPLFQSRPQAYLRLLVEDERMMQDLFYRPQHAFLTDEDGSLALDFVGRFENLQDDYRVICRQVGLPEAVLPRLNPSTHDAYASYYDENLRRRVADLYARDIQLFDYRFNHG